MAQHPVPDSLRTSALSIAKAALDHFPWTVVSTTVGRYPLPVVMAAIAYGETGFGSDKHSPYCPGSYSCGGIKCAGAWQISISAHADRLRELTGSSNPCAWVAWLDNDENCAAMAREVLSSQGFRAWGVYTASPSSYAWYGNYIDAASEMVDLARQQVYVQLPKPGTPTPAPAQQPPATTPPAQRPPYPFRTAILAGVPDWVLITGAGLITAGLTGMIYVAVKR